MLSEVRSGRQIGRASIAAFAVLVVGAGVTYAAQLLTARVIGPESYGVFAYALAIGPGRYRLLGAKRYRRRDYYRTYWRVRNCHF
jgi:hypothetical protein